jgi:transcriptional regulator with XRE-family HTH domain
MELRDKQTLALYMQHKKERTGLNASDLARHAKVSRQFISRLRHGHDTTCRPETADLIARFLDVPLAALFVERPSISSSQNSNQRTKVAA